jgi:glucose/arabinose dehydrogenase
MQLRAEVVAGGFTKPVQIVFPPGDTRMFVVEHAGRIEIVQGGEVNATPFLDIDDRVCCGDLGSEERGLLSLVFHPRYAENGLFYVNYVGNDFDTHIDEFTVSADPDVADEASRRQVMLVDQPGAPNHKGGDLQFDDDLLFISLGDGGGSCDSTGPHAQDTDVLLGKVLRIDPIASGDPYTIPPDNPFAGGGGAPEVWAYGLRNPWRMSFDRMTGDLYIGDVGQGQREEVDVIGPDSTAPLNFGWNGHEGKIASGCDGSTYPIPGTTGPIYDYDRGDGNIVIGGFVYRGSAVPELAGHYFFADGGSGGFVRSLRYDRDSGAVSDVTTWPALAKSGITSFGVDGEGELYYCSAVDNTVFKIVPADQ